MAVVLTISESAGGANVSDSLAGGSTGLDLGQVSNGQYTPLILQASNSGAQDLFISHNAVTNKITDVKFYISQYSGTYGGPATASADFTALSNYGNSDNGATANNADGLSSGLHMDMSWNVAEASQFAPSRVATGQKRIFGKDSSGKNGLSLATAFDLHVDALSYWNGSTEVDATAPVTGQIGRFDDTALGNQAHIKLRAYLPTAATQGGILQSDLVIGYSYTS